MNQNYYLPPTISLTQHTQQKTQAKNHHNIIHKIKSNQHNQYQPTQSIPISTTNTNQHQKTKHKQEPKNTKPTKKNQPPKTNLPAKLCSIILQLLTHSHQTNLPYTLMGPIHQ